MVNNDRNAVVKISLTDEGGYSVYFVTNLLIIYRELQLLLEL
jgi:hypothetical protein